LNFLDQGNYNLKLIKDGNDDKSFISETLKVKRGDTVKIKRLARGGFVGVISVK
jgi:hypothetical protein